MFFQSPVGLTFQNSQPQPRLAVVSHRLLENPCIRSFPALAEARQCSDTSDTSDFGDTTTSMTSPFPHPLDPVEYWREHSRSKLSRLQQSIQEENHRDSISNWRYWRTEAEFWAQTVDGTDTDRQTISDVDYWKAEARFGETTAPYQRLR